MVAVTGVGNAAEFASGTPVDPDSSTASYLTAQVGSDLMNTAAITGTRAELTNVAKAMIKLDY